MDIQTRTHPGANTPATDLMTPLLALCVGLPKARQLSQHWRGRLWFGAVHHVPAGHRQAGPPPLSRVKGRDGDRAYPADFV